MLKLLKKTENHKEKWKTDKENKCQFSESTMICFEIHNNGVDMRFL